MPRKVILLTLSIILSGIFITSFASGGLKLPEAGAATDQNAELFGLVGRDPWYEWNTNPNSPNTMNYEFMDNMARQMALMGVRWVRIEFRADVAGGIRGGVFNYQKYDDFIFNIAPRYHLKILALLGADTITSKSASDPDLFYPRLNDPADRSDRTNNWIRVFAARAKEITDHYGDAVQAYEILNEPNIWYGIAANPDSIGALMSYTYRTLKPDHPNSRFITGAVIAPGAPGSDPLGYLSAIYRSPAVQDYNYSKQYANNNPFPWDGIGWHPYFLENVNASIASTRDAAARMRQAGDNFSKLWITEVGRPAQLNANGCGATAEEADQSDFLTRYYSTILANDLDKVQTIFWFKYEDFYEGDTTHAWGLVKLDTDNKNGYKVSGRAVYLKAGYYAYQNLANPDPGILGLPIDKVAPPANQYSPSNPDGSFYFSETGHTLSGAFLKYWIKYGGLDLFGFPLTEPFQEESRTDGKKYLVQYFQRERFEYHPEFTGTPYEVLLGLLGNDILASACRSFPRAAAPTIPLPADRFYFPETGHYLGFGFKGYWQQHGGLSIFGYPVSEAFSEAGTDGKSYVVQYFQRARFEYHPEFTGTKYEVQLGLLGFQILRQRGWVH
ncbi:hypothetical protein [Candidatus Chlorohelix sp.]|uniref:hypothetical protein n=1 Tax=Candidatus Chlorohelix sp. TaxID=3139201 RepID=UPI0030209982